MTLVPDLGIKGGKYRQISNPDRILGSINVTSTNQVKSHMKSSGRKGQEKPQSSVILFPVQSVVNPPQKLIMKMTDGGFKDNWHKCVATCVPRDNVE